MRRHVREIIVCIYFGVRRSFFHPILSIVASGSNLYLATSKLILTYVELGETFPKGVGETQRYPGLGKCFRFVSLPVLLLRF